MLGNKMLASRSILFSFVLAVFLVSPFANPIHGGVAISPSVVSPGNTQILTADGTEPQPKPSPWFITAA